jgi:hypothetical protein
MKKRRLATKEEQFTVLVNCEVFLAISAKCNGCPRKKTKE